MAHDDQRNAPSGPSIHAVNVAAADAAGPDTEEDFPRLYFRHGHLFKAYFVRGGQHEGAHR